MNLAIDTWIAWRAINIQYKCLALWQTGELSRIYLTVCLLTAGMSSCPPVILKRTKMDGWMEELCLWPPQSNIHFHFSLPCQLTISMSNSLFPQAENNYYELCCALFWWLQGFDGNVWLFTFTISLYLSLKTSISTLLPKESTQLLQISLPTFPWCQALLPEVLHCIEIR